MKTLYFQFLILLLLVAMVSACVEDKIATIAEAIDRVEHKYAPDGRTGIFDVTFVQRDELVILEGKTTIPESLDGLSLTLDSLGIKHEIEVKILPDLTDTLPDFGLVNVSVCNMRSWIGRGRELSTQAVLGTPLKIIEARNDGWYRVQTPDQYLAWLPRNAFITLKVDDFEAWINSDLFVFTERFGWILDKDGSPVSDIVYGSILSVTDYNGQMAVVNLPDQRVGMIDTAHLTAFKAWTSNSTERGEDIVMTAKSYMGVPYMWGGTTPKGFDCSGFTKVVYSNYGIQLPRDASQQINIGLDIPKDTTFATLKPGDLLYFGSKRNSGTFRTSHVAIHIGNGRVIHATGMVKIESLNRADSDFNEDRFDTWHSVKRLTGVEESLVPRLSTFEAGSYYFN